MNTTIAPTLLTTRHDDWMASLRILTKVEWAMENKVRFFRSGSESWSGEAKVVQLMLDDLSAQPHLPKLVGALIQSVSREFDSWISLMQRPSHTFWRDRELIQLYEREAFAKLKGVIHAFDKTLRAKKAGDEQEILSIWALYQPNWHRFLTQSATRKEAGCVVNTIDLSRAFA